MNAVPLAINPASIQSHQNYSDKKGFSFPILSDPDGNVIRAFDCHRSIGKGAKRTVYVIDPLGKVIFAERGQANLADVKERILKTV